MGMDTITKMTRTAYDNAHDDAGLLRKVWRAVGGSTGEKSASDSLMESVKLEFEQEIESKDELKPDQKKLIVSGLRFLARNSFTGLESYYGHDDVVNALADIDLDKVRELVKAGATDDEFLDAARQMAMVPAWTRPAYNTKIIKHFQATLKEDDAVVFVRKPFWEKDDPIQAAAVKKHSGELTSSIRSKDVEQTGENLALFRKNCANHILYVHVASAYAFARKLQETHAGYTDRAEKDQRTIEQNSNLRAREERAYNAKRAASGKGPGVIRSVRRAGEFGASAAVRVEEGAAAVVELRAELGSTNEKLNKLIDVVLPMAASIDPEKLAEIAGKAAGRGAISETADQVLGEGDVVQAKMQFSPEELEAWYKQRRAEELKDEKAAKAAARAAKDAEKKNNS